MKQNLNEIPAEKLLTEEETEQIAGGAGEPFGDISDQTVVTQGGPG